MGQWSASWLPAPLVTCYQRSGNHGPVVGQLVQRVIGREEISAAAPPHQSRLLQL